MVYFTQHTLSFFFQFETLSIYIFKRKVNGPALFSNNNDHVNKLVKLGTTLFKPIVIMKETSNYRSHALYSYAPNMGHKAWCMRQLN